MIFTNSGFRICIGLACLLAINGNASEGARFDDSHVIKSGNELYLKHCAICHGIKAEGAPHWKKLNAQGELPPPPHGPEGHTWRHSDKMLQQMINHGWRYKFNKTQRLTMPAFNKELSQEDISAVISYLKTLWTPEQRIFQKQESIKQTVPSLSQ